MNWELSLSRSAVRGKKPTHRHSIPAWFSPNPHPCPCGRGKKYKNCCGKNG
ncbi:MAG: SEC-C domain-containing protein [Bacteroidales bacterium]|nr:SEC-C domain-containing protein [Bacteroidales bacterium]